MKGPNYISHMIYVRNKLQIFVNYMYLSIFCIICALLLVGDHSKITLSTKNVFIESTATDLHKVNNTFMNESVHVYY